MAQFNLGEVLFLNKKYPEARERFQIFVNSQPKNDLGLYKMYLCDLLGDQKKRANSFLQSLEPSPNSPIYYFSKAAEAFVKGDKAAAMEFVGSAYRIYPPLATTSAGIESVYTFNVQKSYNDRVPAGTPVVLMSRF